MTDNSEPQTDPAAQGSGISDDQLPEDLQPGEDNPLAEPLDPDDEATKDLDELDMDATQEDKGYTASGDAAGQATADPDASTRDTSTQAAD